MIGQLVTKLHFIAFIWMVWSFYDRYDVHQETLKEVNSKAPMIKKKLVKKQKELEAINDYLEDIEKAKDTIEKVALQIEELQQKLPDKISDTENLEVITSIAEKINLKGMLLRPGKERDEDFYITKEYNFTSRGTYLQFLIFLEKIGELSKSQQLFNVSSIELIRIDGKRKGRFQLIEGKISVLAYKYNESYREDRGISTIEREYRNKKVKKKGRKKPKVKKKGRK